jgi:light-regulated signal transduction histidine kinase (bacteriophytochrome)
MPPQIRIYAKNNVVRNLGKTESIPFTNILVQDNGIGFEQKYAEQIFEIFKRLHGSSEFSGTGIGLALCRKIVEKHHGYISAQSQPENGAIFTVSLPLAEHVKTDSEKKHVKDLA